MNAAILPIAQTIAEDALTLAQWVMDKQGIQDPKVREDIAYTISLSDNMMIDLLFNDYITYIEKGRKPNGEMPPLSAIRDWALRKNLPTDNYTLYAIAKTIARDGIAPRPIMDLLIVELEKAFENDWYVDLFNYIVEQIQLFFDE